MTKIRDVRTPRKLAGALKVTLDSLVPDGSSEEDALRQRANAGRQEIGSWRPQDRGQQPYHRRRARNQFGWQGGPMASL